MSKRFLIILLVLTNSIFESLICSATLAEDGALIAGRIYGEPFSLETARDALGMVDGTFVALLDVKQLIGAKEQGDVLLFLDSNGNYIGNLDSSRAKDKDGKTNILSAMAVGGDGRLAAAFSHEYDLTTPLGIAVIIYGADYKPVGYFEKLAGNNERSRTIGKIIPASDGGYAAVGNYFAPVDNKQKAFFLRIDRTGKSRLMADIDGPSSLDAIAQTPDGGFFIAGKMGAVGGGNIYAGLVSADRRIMFSQEFTSFGTDTVAISSAFAFDTGGYAIAGYYPPPGAALPTGALSYVWSINLDAGGNIVGAKRMPYNSNTIVTALSFTSDGGCVVAGSRKSGDGIIESFIERTDANLKAVWTKQFTYKPLKTDGKIYGVINFANQTPDGGYILGGSTGGAILGEDQQAWLVRFDATGSPVW